MRLTHFGRLQTYRNARRLWLIAAVFLRCVFDYLRCRLRLRRERNGKGTPTDLGICLGTALRLACERLGPTFIKFGQVLSTRRDIFPAGVAGELARLQDGVEPMPLADAVRVVESEYHRPISQVFSSFSEKPLGAASLAQVHAAQLATTGEAVVVKVQRPGIQSMVDADIGILRRFIPLFERHVDEFRHLNLHSVIGEFYKTIRMEMDFKREMYNTLKFRKIFADDPTVKIPAVHKALCTDKVLVLEKLEGVKIDQVDALVGLGYDRDVLSKRLVSALAKQVFTHGLYNGDVHAGNIRVLPGAVLGLLDFGMVRTIDPETQRLMADLFVALVTKDSVRMSRILAAYAEPGYAVDTLRLARDLHELIVFYYDLPEEDICVETLLEDVMDLLATHKLILPQQLIMLCRAAVMTESLVRLLSPGMCFVVELSPYIKEAIKNRFSFDNLSGELGKFATDTTRAIKALPTALVRFLTSLNDGSPGAESRRTDLDRPFRQYHRAITGLMMSVLSGALFVGSVLVLIFVPHGDAAATFLGRIGLTAAAVFFGAALFALTRRE